MPTKMMHMPAPWWRFWNRSPQLIATRQVEIDPISGGFEIRFDELEAGAFIEIPVSDMLRKGGEHADT